MIEEYAWVVEAAEGYAWVETRRRSACGSCSVGDACGTSVIAKLFADRSQRFQVRNDLGALPGERVVVGISDATLARASLTAYLFPLLLLMGAALLAQALGAGEGLSALVGLIGLGLGLALAGRSGTRGRERYRPLMLRRISDRRLPVAGPRI
jgi:sigma-E factor negative regulatory protein RseC